MYVDKSLRNGLVGEWLFDPMTGDALLDTSGYGSAALFSRGTPEWVAKSIGPAVYFDGSSGLTIQNTFEDLLGETTAKSLEIFARAGGTVPTARRAVTIYRAPASSAFTIFVDTASDTWGYGYRNSGGYQTRPSASADLTRFQHVVLVQNGTSIRIWVDSSPSTEYTDAVAPGLSSPPNADIGQYNSTEGWENDIALVRIYARALAGSEIFMLNQLVLQRGQPDRRIWHIPFVEDESKLRERMIAIPGGMTPLEPYK